MTRTRPYLLTALLLDVLETEGWKIGTGQQLRIQELLRQLPDDVDDDALGLALAPLLARNPQEQSLVYEKLEECRRRADELAEVPSAYRAQEQAEAARTHRRWRIWLPLALLGLLGLGIGIGYWQMGKPQPVEIIRKEFSVNKGQNTQICPSDFADSDSLRGNVTYLTIMFQNSFSKK